MDPTSEFWFKKCVDSNVPGRTNKDYEVVIEVTMKHLLRCEEHYPVMKYQLKSKEKAAEKLKDGNKYYLTQGNFFSALESYTQGIAYAPLNSKELAKGYANRSAVTCEIGHYEDSLKDIERALKIGYPDDLKAKLYARRARNLMSLDPIMRPEVEEAISEARQWMSSMNYPHKKKIENILQDLSKIDLKAEDWNPHEFYFSAPDANSKILQASDAITIKYNEEFGRHIVATKNIDAGDTVFVHKPYAAIISSNNFYRYCWYCLKAVMSGVPCHECVNVIYCDENCRDEAWKEHHHIECPVITSMLSENMKESDIMALRIFIKALNEMGSVQNLKDQVDKLNSIIDPIDQLLTNNVFDDTKYASVFGLKSDTSFAWRSPTYTHHLKCIFILYYLAATTDNIFDKKMTDFKDLANDKQSIFIGSLLLKHFDINLMNSYTTDVFQESDGEYSVRGIMLLPLLSLFNHSCDFNMCYHTSGNKIALNAVKMIKEGEQLTVNYGADFQLRNTEERKFFLEVRYNFVCNCVACLNDWCPDYKFPSFLELSVPLEVKRKIQKAFEEDISHNLSILKLIETKPVCESRLESMLKLFKLFDEAKIVYPCTELIHCRGLLIQMYIQDSC